MIISEYYCEKKPNSSIGDWHIYFVLFVFFRYPASLAVWTFFHFCDCFILLWYTQLTTHYLSLHTLISQSTTSWKNECATIDYVLRSVGVNGQQWKTTLWRTGFRMCVAISGSSEKQQDLGAFDPDCLFVWYFSNVFLCLPIEITMDFVRSDYIGSLCPSFR